MIVDAWGTPLAASEAATADAWNHGWDQALHFVGDPIATMTEAGDADDAFALGAIFCATYRLLGGLPSDNTDIVGDIERARARAHTARERGHVEALEHLAAGDFTEAGRAWDRVARADRDIAAVRFAHDVYLHVGDAARRLTSSAFAIGMFDDSAGWNLVASQYAFALEETGHFAEAERVAFEALDADPGDLWAMHAAAHVYEHLDEQDKAIALFDDPASGWAERDGLAVHMWWHLTLRLIAAGDFDRVLQIHDDLVPQVNTPFRLSDLISMLWRLELRGVAVGDRWDHLADAMAFRPEWHTNGFLDLHAALVYSRRPAHPAAQAFFDGVAGAHAGETSENATIFAEVVRPLVVAVDQARTDATAARAALGALAPTLHRIGGSNAQRDIVQLTQDHLAHSMIGTAP